MAKIVANVFDAILKNKKTGEVIAMDTLTDAGIDISTESKEVRGGKGNKLIAKLSSTRTITINLTNPAWDLRTIAMQLGQSIVTAEGVGYAAPKNYAVATGKKISLDKTPLTGTVVVEKDGKIIPSSNYTVSAKDVTFTSGVEVGETVKVATYQYTAPAGTEKVEISSKKFAEAWELILVTFESNSDGSEAEELQIRFPEATPTGNFSINTSAGSDASSTNIELQILEGNSEVQAEILRIPLT